MMIPIFAGSLRGSFAAATRTRSKRRQASKRRGKTFRKIHTLPFRPAVILVSCEDTRENSEYAKALGALDFIPKPIDFARFKTTVDAALEGKQKARPARRTGVAADKPGGTIEMRILIVGGETPDRKAIGKPIEKAGFRTNEAGSARSALEIVLK